MTAFAFSIPRIEKVETRANLFGGIAAGGQSVLLEYDWIYRNLALPESRSRPALGLYASWIHGQDPGGQTESELAALGATFKFLSLPSHTGADAYFAMRMGLAYGFAGDEPTRGFAGDDLQWMDLSLAGGIDLGRFHGLQPVIELHLSPSNLLAGARFGLSLPLFEKLPLPPAPPPSSPAGPLLHGGLGAVFASQDAGWPIADGKWFGGLAEAGVSLYRTPRRQVILGMRALVAGARPLDGWGGTRPGLRMAAITVAWQDFGSPGFGLGYRVTAGVPYYSRYRDGHGSARSPMPVFGVAVLAPTRSGFYPFMEIGGFGSNPVVLGVGRGF